jgi:hypothetical protein
VFEKVLHDETFHMTYTTPQLQRVSPKAAGGASGWRGCAGSGRPTCARQRARGPVGAVILTLQYLIILPPFAWRKRAAASEGWSPVAPEPQRRPGPAVLMKILGISAHYHDSAAALVVDGLPVAAVQEERLSRRKNDAAFPAGAIEWCLEAGGIEPEDLDAVVFYERPMLKFDRILTTALRAFRTGAAGVHPRHEELAGREGVGARADPGAPGRAAQKILFTEHHQSHAAAAFLTAPDRGGAILTTDGVGEWATLTVGRGSATPGGHDHRAAARGALAAFAGDALLDLHRLPGLRGERGRVQGHGPGVVRDARASPTTCAG